MKIKNTIMVILTIKKALFKVIFINYLPTVKKYNAKKVVLIYPKWQKFNDSFDFQLGDDLLLKVKPFDLTDNDFNINLVI
jgi:hypothetical protein